MVLHQGRGRECRLHELNSSVVIENERRDFAVILAEADAEQPQLVVLSVASTSFLWARAGR